MDKKLLKSVRIKFNLRTPSITDRLSAVKCVIRWNNQTLTFYSVDNIIPTFWDNVKQRAKGTRSFPEYPEFNARLDKIEIQIKDAYRNFVNDNNCYPSVAEFKAVISEKLTGARKGGKTTDFFEFISIFIEESKNRTNDKTGKPLSETTISAYKRTFEILRGFAKKCHKRTIHFEDITLDFYYDFKAYLTADLMYSTNTVGKHIKTLKAFLNDATERGINRKLDFKSRRFKVTKEPVENIYLNEDELEVLYQMDLTTNKRLERVRDLFLVGCWTGLRFSDFNTINPTDIIDNEYIEIETKKTRQKVVIPLNSIVQDIMRRYKEATPNSMPPPISNVKMNMYVKELGELADISSIEMLGRTKGGVETRKTYQKFQLITTHTARRSFATNMYLRGVPTITIMAITGHRTEKAFMQYIKVTPKEHAEVLKSYFISNNGKLHNASV